MPALNSRITEGSDLVRDTTPTPQQRAQSVLMGLAHVRGALDGIEENVATSTPDAFDKALARARRYIDTAEEILGPLAYPRLTEERR